MPVRPVRLAFALSLAALVVLAPGCMSHTVAQTADFNGMTSPTGKQLSHVNSTSIALHLLFSKPLVGDASLPTVMQANTKQQQSQGAQHVRVTQSSVSTWWWCLPPISFFIHPVFTNVATDGERGGEE